MPWEFVGKSTNYTKVRSIQNLYTTLHKTILVFANIGSMEKFFLIFSVSPLVHVNLNKYKSEALFSIKLLLYIEKYYIITKMTAPLQYSVWWEKRGVWNLNFESWLPIICGIMKVKRANRLMSINDEIWVIHLQNVDTLLMIGI